MKDLKATLEAGRGILDIRVLYAAVAGPACLAMGAKRSYALTPAAPDGTQIGDNIATADAVVLLGISAEGGVNAVGVTGLLSKDEQLGISSSWPVLFLPFANRDAIHVILLPGEQLYAKALAADVRILVSEVQFR